MGTSRVGWGGVVWVSARRGSGPSPGSGTTIEWASALAALPDPLFIMEAVRDPDGTVVELTYSFLNEAAARLYGMSVDEVMGHGQIELFPSVMGIWDSYLGVIESGSPTSFDVPFFNENGVEGSFRLTATKFGDGLLISANDTTAQVKAEKAVEADTATLRATLDSLMDPHVLFEAVRDGRGQIVDFRFADANPAACAYDGIAYQDLVGSRMLEHYPGVVGAGLLKQYAQVVETGHPIRLDDVVYAMETMGRQDRYLDISAVRVGDGLSYTWRDVTERHEALEYGRRMAAVVEQSHEAIIGVSFPDLLVTSWNRAAERMYGYTAQEAIGKTPFILTLKEQLVEQVKGQISQLAAGEPVVDFESVRIRKDGTEIQVSVSASPIRDANGVTVGLSTIHRDITKEKQAREYADRMAAVVQYSGDGIVSGSLDGRVASWNPAAERMYGFTAEEVIGTSFGPRTPEHLIDQSKAVLEQVKAGQVVQNVEGERIRKDGTLCPVSLTVSPVRDADGVVVAYSAIHRDLSHQREAVELSRSMIEASLDSMLSISPDGIITDANQATVSLTGVPRDKLIGTLFSDYFTDPDQAEQGFRQALEVASVTDYPLTLSHHDRGERLVEVQYNASAYHDLSGQVLGVFAVARDMTQQLQAQREIAEQQQREMARLAELEQFQRATVGRELKMIELKKEIDYLKKYGPAGSSDLGEGSQT